MDKKENYIAKSKYNAEINNPCVKEQNLSYKCLTENNYDRDSCTVYFHNYRNCKEFWNTVMSKRRSKGIRPYLPLPEDRPKIKAEYLKADNK